MRHTDARDRPSAHGAGRRTMNEAVLGESA